MAATINNLFFCSATTRNPVILHSYSKFITSIPFSSSSSSFHLSTKLSKNPFRNYHLLSQRSVSNSLLDAETDEEDYDDLNQPQNAFKTADLEFKSNFVIMAAALTVGVAVLLIDQKAMALGPEGPLAEEFWENMRRYALYALTVSSGVAYAVFQPIYELLRNPISAVLIIAIGVGGFYLVSQVLSAMVGVSDFNYQYSY